MAHLRSDVDAGRQQLGSPRMLASAADRPAFSAPGGCRCRCLYCLLLTLQAAQLLLLSGAPRGGRILPCRQLPACVPRPAQRLRCTLDPSLATFCF